MLGKLAWWLRLLGYDVLYSPKMDDAELAQVARIENRVLLTRDTQLVKRRGLRFVLVESDQPERQIRQLVHQLDLDTRSQEFSRCLVCNSPLFDVAAETIAHEVPPYVRATQTRFRRCPNCSRIYWRGTHWERMMERLKTLRQPSP